jgi:DNA-binding NarL/FixJ family response regulator
MARRQDLSDGHRRGGVTAPAVPADGTVRLFILRGRRFVAEAVIEAWRRDDRLRVVGAAAAPADAIGWLGGRDADVVLVDASDDRERALEGVRRLRDAKPLVKILAFGIADEVDDVADFAEAGARACLPLGAPFEELTLAVHELHRERTRCSPALAARLVARIAALEQEEPPAVDPSDAELTGRERQVLAFLVVGLTNKEIAQRLDVAVATVKNHVHNLLAKLGVHRRQDAVRTAYLTGLTDRFLPCRPKRGSRGEVPPSRSGPVTTANG